MHEIDTNSLRSKLPFTEKLGELVTSAEEFRGDITLVVPSDKIRDAISTLKTQCQFNMMSDIVGIDYLKFEPEQPERFAVIYILYSFALKMHLRVKTFLPEDKPSLPSIHDLYAAANWFEREAFDLFGVEFTGHPNLQRILCHQDFVGHPLRKDYPSDQYQRLKTASPSTGF